MQISQVRYFLAVCAESSFTRAARKCGVAQPSLTQALLRLEAELGGALFTRGRKGSRLTELGALVRHHLADIERSEQLAKRKAADFVERRRQATQRIPQRNEASHEQTHLRNRGNHSTAWKGDVRPCRPPDDDIASDNQQLG